MIVVDTSVLVAIMGDEPERRAFNERIAEAAEARISAASLLEARIVLFAVTGRTPCGIWTLFFSAAG